MPSRRPLDGTMPTRTDAHLQPLLGVSPLGPVMLSKENIAQAQMLETVYRHLPQPADSEKVRYDIRTGNHVLIVIVMVNMLTNYFPGPTCKETLTHHHHIITNTLLQTLILLTCIRGCPLKHYSSSSTIWRSALSKYNSALSTSRL